MKLKQSTEKGTCIVRIDRDMPFGFYHTYMAPAVEEEDAILVLQIQRAYHEMYRCVHSDKNLTDAQTQIVKCFLRGEMVYTRETYPTPAPFKRFIDHMLERICMTSYNSDLMWCFDWSHRTYIANHQKQMMEVNIKSNATMNDILVTLEPFNKNEWLYSWSEEDRIFFGLADEESKRLYKVNTNLDIISMWLNENVVGHCINDITKGLLVRLYSAVDTRTYEPTPT